MQATRYPFIDLAVHPVIRDRFAAGEALAVLDPENLDVLWANGAAASLFGHRSLHDFLEEGIGGQPAASRQIAATASAARTSGSERTAKVRLASGFTRQLIDIAIAPMTLPSGSVALLMASPAASGATAAARARTMVQGLESADTAAAVLGEDGTILAASAGFGDLGLSGIELADMVALVARESDRCVKRMVSSASGKAAAAIGRISDDPVMNMIVAVVPDLDGESDDAPEPMEADTAPAPSAMPVLPVMVDETGEPEDDFLKDGLTEGDFLVPVPDPAEESVPASAFDADALRAALASSIPQAPQDGTASGVFDEARGIEIPEFEEEDASSALSDESGEPEGLFIDEDMVTLPDERPSSPAERRSEPLMETTPRLAIERRFGTFRRSRDAEPEAQSGLSDPDQAGAGADVPAGMPSGEAPQEPKVPLAIERRAGAWGRRKQDLPAAPADRHEDEPQPADMLQNEPQPVEGATAASPESSDDDFAQNIAPYVADPEADIAAGDMPVLSDDGDMSAPGQWSPQAETAAAPDNETSDTLTSHTETTDLVTPGVQDEGSESAPDEGTARLSESDAGESAVRHEAEAEGEAIEPEAVEMAADTPAESDAGEAPSESDDRDAQSYHGDNTVWFDTHQESGSFHSGADEPEAAHDSGDEIDEPVAEGGPEPAADDGHAVHDAPETAEGELESVEAGGFSAESTDAERIEAPAPPEDTRPRDDENDGDATAEAMESGEADTEALEDNTLPDVPREPSFVFDPAMRPQRFVWKIDRDGAFSEVSPEFALAVGPNAADIKGRRFTDIAQVFNLDPDHVISDLLTRRDTWSGKTVYWPVQGTALSVPVDLAALPTYTRDRVFDGFRGFGVVRAGEVRPDKEALGLALVPGYEAVPPVSGPADDTMSAFADEDAVVDEDDIANLAELDGVTEAEVFEEGDPFQGERPALHVAETPARRESDTVIDLASRRGWQQKPALSAGEQAAFREIGARLSEATREDDVSGSGAPENPDPSLALQDDTDQGSEPDAPADVMEEAGAAADEIDDEAEELGFAPQDDDNPIIESYDDADILEEEDAPTDERTGNTDDDDTNAADEDDGAAAALIGAVGGEAGNGEETRLSGDEPSLETAGADEVQAEADDGPADDESANETGETQSFADERAPGDPDDAAGTGTPVEESGEQETDLAGDDGLYADATGSFDTATPDGTDADDTAPDAEHPAAHFAGEPQPFEEDESAASEEDAPATASGFALPSRLAMADGMDQKTIDAIPVALLVHAGDRLIHANPEFFSLTGYASLDALDGAGGIGHLITDPGDGDPSSGTMRLSLADGGALSVTARLRSIAWQGSQALVLALTPVAGAGLSAMGVAGMASSDMVDGEADGGEAAMSREHALQIETQELRSILETATDGVVILDNDGTIRSMNGSACALFNFDEAELQGQPFAVLFAHESQKAVQDYVHGLTGHGVTSVLNDGREVIGREAGGGFLPLFMTIGRLSGSNGYCAVLRDITQWKRTEEELRTAKRAAETANSHKSDFLARVSHEIRTPLNAIIGFSEMMVEQRFGPIGSPRYLEYAHDIGNSGKYVLDIVNDLLDISKIEAGQVDMDFTAVGLNDQLAESVSLLQPMANSKRVIIRTSLSSQVPEVVADQRSIKQITLNLLSNSIRFTPSGGQIVVSTAYETTGAVTLRIRDTGIGMSRKELEHAMQPFSQVNIGSRPRGDGTGLGLPLTKAMVEANRAQFDIVSSPGEGTLVTITFPPQRVLAD